MIDMMSEISRYVTIVKGGLSMNFIRLMEISRYHLRFLVFGWERISKTKNYG